MNGKCDLIGMNNVKMLLKVLNALAEIAWRSGPTPS